MSDANHILCFITIGDTEESVGKLIEALKDIAASIRKPQKQNVNNFFLTMPRIPELVLTPREAFFAPKKRIPLVSAVGKISGEFITPFPPDVPIVLPGEKMNQEILDYVKYLKKNNVTIVGPQDTSLETIEIIEESNCRTADVGSE